MQRIKETLKDAVHPGRRHEREAAYAGQDTYDTTGTAGLGTTGTTGMGATGVDTGYASGVETGYASGTTGTGMTSGEVVEERPVGVGVAEVPVVVTEQERIRTEGEHHHHHHERMSERVGEEVCGTKTFTEVEDRPIVKERVERVLEHQPVEKQYVVETRFVGEAAIPSATGATVIDTTERIVERAEPGPKCPTSAGGMMDEAIGRRI